MIRWRISLSSRALDIRHIVVVDRHSLAVRDEKTVRQRTVVNGQVFRKEPRKPFGVSGETVTRQ